MYVDNFLILSLFTVSAAINHFVLKDDGRIAQRVDSPFLMREPDNLIAFLDQIRYNDFVETAYLALLRQREQIVEHLRFSLRFGEDLVEQAKCAMNYYMMEKRMSYLELTPAYLKRLNFSDHVGVFEKSVIDEPNCQHFAPSDSPCGYDHLESFQPDVINSVHMEREENTSFGDLSSILDVFRRLALNGLTLQPKSWRFHTISSYYWRLRGQAKQALECACLGAKFAPGHYRDIPLLSLGTILFRSGRLSDSDAILTIAAKLAPDAFENHIALASVLAMTHDFNRSLYHFDEAERLNPSILPRTLPVRNFVGCLENLTKKTAKMYSYVEYMKNEVKEFKNLKRQISRNHEKLIQQQVPLGARYLDGSAKTNSEELLKRGQYCSTRTLSSSEMPILFCDFYSDLQMRLESKDVDIESLETDLKLTSEAVIKQVSTEFYKQLNFQQKKKSTQAPKPIKKSTEVEETSADDKKRKPA